MTVVDLFCGCGGLSKGFELAGFTISAAFDGWSAAITCYNANFEHEAYLRDLSDVDGSVKAITVFKPTVIIGGPPCQEFSNAGKRKEGARADLTYDYARIVTTIHPQFFIMENVPRVQNSKAYEKARKLYKEKEYGLTEVVLDASRCGVPQKRKRFFCIGALNEQDNFLLDSIFNACQDKEISIREYFEAHNVPLDIDHYYRHPTTYTRRAVFPVNEASPTIRGVNRPKPETYKRNKKDSVEESELKNVRALTLTERAMIQTFPSDFRFNDLGISKGDLEQMVGNAVPVELARFVAERLLDYMKRKDHDGFDQDEFATWLRTEKRYTSDRSISDVFSRIRRAESMLPDQEINRYFIADLAEEPNYQKLPTSVRSQIKKALNLRIAFESWKKNHD